RPSETYASLDGYGPVSLRVLGLYRATGEQRWLREAEALVAIVREQFTDRELGGFYYTPADGERLIARHKELDDNPTPSGQSLMATVLLQLARLHGDDALESEAAGVLRLAAPYMERPPRGVRLRAVRLPGAGQRPRRAGSVAARMSDPAAGLKRDAAEAAIDAEVQSGMTLGLGTGSTAAFLLDGLAARLEDGALAEI